MPGGYQIQRVYWGAKGVGQGSFNWDWDAIHANSVVLIAASEYDPGAPPDADGSARRIISNTLIRVCNIAPHGPPSDPHRGVTFVIEIVTIPFGLPEVNLCTDIIVFDATTNADVVYVEGAASPQH
jgi:hypothetical protein